MVASRCLRAFAILGCCLGIAAAAARPAAAQQTESDEVKKAVEAAIQSAIGNSIEETLRTNLSATQAQPEAQPANQPANMNTFWARPEYLSVVTSFGPFSSTTPVVIAPVGAVFRLNQDMFLGVSASYTHVGGKFSADDVGGDVIGTYVIASDAKSNIRGNLDLGFVHFLPGTGGSATTYQLTPSVDFEHTFGPVVATLSPGASFGWSDPSGPDDPSKQVILAAKAVYIDGPIQPQLSVEWQKALGPGDTTDGTVSVTPEVNYVSGNLTVGIGYIYSTVLGGNFTSYSHAALATLRVRF